MCAPMVNAACGQRMTSVQCDLMARGKVLDQAVTARDGT